MQKELQGTQKQVDWAVDIRNKFYDFVETINVDLTKAYKDRERMEKRGRFSKKDFYENIVKLENFKKSVMIFLEEETDATQFIKYRDVAEMNFELELEQSLKYNFFYHVIGEAITLVDEYYREDVVEETVKEETEENSTVIPENFNETIAVVEEREESIFIKIPYSKESTKLIKDNGFYWIGHCWKRRINTTFNGDVIDRMAEVGNGLLSIGYGIKFESESFLEVKNKAIHATYQREITNWIISKDYKGDEKFFIVWRGYNDELYKAAKSLPYAKWDKAMIVDSIYYNQVVDFASVYDFKFNSTARRLIDRQKALETDRQVVTKGDDYNVTNKLVEKLENPDEIVEDLLDD